MRLRIGTTLLAVLGTAGGAAAQPVPAEPPPSGYTAREYTDSHGCTFLRAEHGARMLWAPLLDRDRRQVCAAPVPPPEPRAPQAEDRVQTAPRRSEPTERRSATVIPQPPHRYVQVGAYAEPENARMAIDRLAALGLPVSMAEHARRNGPLQIILAGPFQRQADLRAALHQLRASGFPDAYSRN